MQLDQLASGRRVAGEMDDRIDPGERGVTRVGVGDVELFDAVAAIGNRRPQAPAIAQPLVTADPIAPAAPVTSTRGLSVIR